MCLSKLPHPQVCPFSLQSLHLLLREVHLGIQFLELFVEDCALLKDSISLGPCIADLRRKRPLGLLFLASPEPLFGNGLKSCQVERSSERPILIQFDAAQQLSAQFLDPAP